MLSTPKAAFRSRPNNIFIPRTWRMALASTITVFFLIDGTALIFFPKSAGDILNVSHFLDPLLKGILGAKELQTDLTKKYA
jgi:hypothetical protein